MALANPNAAASFSIATPGDWANIRLPQGERDADDLAAVLADSWPGQASSVEELREMARSLMNAAAALDVLGAYATVLNGHGRLLPASLVINVFPLRGKTLGQVAEELSGGDGAPGREGHAWWTCRRAALSGSSGCGNGASRRMADIPCRCSFSMWPRCRAAARRWC